MTTPANSPSPRPGYPATGTAPSTGTGDSAPARELDTLGQRPSIAPGDFTITLKTVHKACFGSAGCNVEVQPNIAYAHSLSELDAYGSCDITYTISGGESGDQVETATGTGTGHYSAQNSLLQTSSSGVVPKATITSITCH